MFATGLVLKFAMLIVETSEKRRLLKSPYSAYPSEALSDIVNRSVFCGLTRYYLRAHQVVYKWMIFLTLTSSCRLKNSMPTSAALGLPHGSGHLTLLYRR